MRKICLLILLSAFFVSARGSDVNIFNSANAAYKNGKFDEALKGYQQLLDSGNKSAVLYYNLGNANYRLDNIAAAILNYEKAHKIAPGDEDIQMNLKLANLKIADKIEDVPEFFLKTWWIGFITMFSLQVWAVLSVLFFLTGFLLLTFYLFSRKLSLKRISFYSGISLIAMALAFMGISSGQDNYFQDHKEAIVFSGVVDVKSAPDSKQKTLFVIHEGIKLRLLDSAGEWFKVELPNGNVGWIGRNTVQRI